MCVCVYVCMCVYIRPYTYINASIEHGPSPGADIRSAIQELPFLMEGKISLSCP
jgi:hypothetical protein